jgi:hypothetical protein
MPTTGLRTESADPHLPFRRCIKFASNTASGRLAQSALQITALRALAIPTPWFAARYLVLKFSLEVCSGLS